MIKTYATLGPACCERTLLAQMLERGLTGFRLNLSHKTLPECREWTEELKKAAAITGTTPELIIDLRGPELRLAALPSPVAVADGETVRFGQGGIPLDGDILAALRVGQEILVDDGAIVLAVEEVSASGAVCRCLQGGLIEGRKSLTLPGLDIVRPAVSKADLEDLAVARAYGVTAVMQPFVRKRSDLEQVREALHRFGLGDFKIFAKVEDNQGVENLVEWMDLADVVTIARGDLGSNLPLPELPRAQKRISKICRERGQDFLVVTHLLQSMIHSPVPTRAEVTDIYNACLDGAAALMITGETAQGKHGLAAVEMLLAVAKIGEEDR